MQKQCSKCKITKNTKSFYVKYKLKKGISKYQSYCKSCLLKTQMQRWKAIKEKAICYKGGKCIDCNISYNRPEVYQFHHIDPKTKSFTWNQARLKSWDKITTELDKCVLLCSNCHILRHSNDITIYQ